MPLPEETRASLKTAGLHIDQFGSAALEAADPDSLVAGITASLTAADVPVKKRLFDWLLFRRRSSIQRKLFGPPEQPTQRISVQDKAARLGDEAKLRMRRSLDRHRGEVFSSTGEAIEKGMLEPHAKSLVESLRHELNTRSKDLGDRLDALQREIVAARRVQNKVDSLKQHIQAARDAVGELHKEDSLLGEVQDVEIVPPDPLTEARAMETPDEAQEQAAVEPTLEETVSNAFEAAIEKPQPETAESEPSQGSPWSRPSGE